MEMIMINPTIPMIQIQIVILILIIHKIAMATKGIKREKIINIHRAKGRKRKQKNIIQIKRGENQKDQGTNPRKQNKRITAMFTLNHNHKIPTHKILKRRRMKKKMI